MHLIAALSLGFSAALCAYALYSLNSARQRAQDHTTLVVETVAASIREVVDGIATSLDRVLVPKPDPQAAEAVALRAASRRNLFGQETEPNDDEFDDSDPTDLFLPDPAYRRQDVAGISASDPSPFGIPGLTPRTRETLTGMGGV